MGFIGEARARAATQERALAGAPRALLLLTLAGFGLTALALWGLVASDHTPAWALACVGVAAGVLRTTLRAGRRGIEEAPWLDEADRRVWNGWWRVLGPFVVPFAARELARGRRGS